MKIKSIRLFNKNNQEFIGILSGFKDGPELNDLECVCKNNSISIDASVESTDSGTFVIKDVDAMCSKCSRVLYSNSLSEIANTLFSRIKI